MNFEFFSSARIIFGCGGFDRLSTIASQLGSRFLIVSSGGYLKRSGKLEKLQIALDEKGLSFFSYDEVKEEPTPEIVDSGLKFALKHNCDAVIAVGGGSVIDAGKAIAGLITNGGPVIEYLEGVGKGRIPLQDPVPFIAVPTTSGTGSEVTKNAVITSLEMKFKKSFRSEKLIPDVALVDPLLTLSLPPEQTARSGMDALTQLIESFLSKKANPVSDALARLGMEFAGRFLRRAFLNGDDIEAREGMALASLLSGVCLANSGLGAVHGIAAALGCHVGIPHGLACAVLLPHVMEFNMDANPEKTSEIGRILTGDTFSHPRDNSLAALEAVKQLLSDINIPDNFKEFGVCAADLPAIAKASYGSSMSGNPVEMTEQDIISILNRVI